MATPPSLTALISIPRAATVLSRGTPRQFLSRKGTNIDKARNL